MGKGGLAQEQAWRKALDCAVHHAGGVLRFDFALGKQPQLRDRAAGGKRMDDIAERVFMRLQPAVGRHVDAPIHYVLAIVVARRQAQRLDHAGGRCVVAIDGLVRDADAHGCSHNARADEIDTAPNISPLAAASGEREQQVHGAGDSTSCERALIEDAPEARPVYIKYWELTAAPSALLSATNSSMNSCSPVWKISS